MIRKQSQAEIDRKNGAVVFLTNCGKINNNNPVVISEAIKLLQNPKTTHLKFYRFYINNFGDSSDVCHLSWKHTVGTAFIKAVAVRDPKRAHLWLSQLMVILSNPDNKNKIDKMNMIKQLSLSLILGALEIIRQMHYTVFANKQAVVDNLLAMIVRLIVCPIYFDRIDKDVEKQVSELIKACVRSTLGERQYDKPNDQRISFAFKVITLVFNEMRQRSRDSEFIARKRLTDFGEMILNQFCFAVFSPMAPLAKTKSLSLFYADYQLEQGKKDEANELVEEKLRAMEHDARITDVVQK